MPAKPPTYVPRRFSRKPRRVGLVIVMCLVTVVATVVGVGGAYASRLQNAFNSANVVAQEDVLPTYEDQPYKDPGDDSMNILLLGADRSEGGSKPNLTASGTDQRSDSMMILHIPQGHKGAYLMSMVRDTYVTIPGHGKNKLNSALQFGGVPLLRQTIEGMLDARIDHVAMVDFQSFRGLSSAIGGVTVDNPKAFCAYKTTPDVCFEAGKITIEGQRALKWVRERHAFPTSDYQRVKNQQQFLKQVFNKVLSPEVLASPIKIANVMEKVMPFVTMDSKLHDEQMLIGLAMQMKDLRAKDIKNFTLPTAGTSTVGGESMELDNPIWDRKVGDAMEKGTMAALYKEIPDHFKDK